MVSRLHTSHLQCFCLTLCIGVVVYFAIFQCFEMLYHDGNSLFLHRLCILSLGSLQLCAITISNFFYLHILFKIYFCIVQFSVIDLALLEMVFFQPWLTDNTFHTIFWWKKKQQLLPKCPMNLIFLQKLYAAVLIHLRNPAFSQIFHDGICTSPSPDLIFFP